MSTITNHFTEPLLNWYKHEARDLPWRNTRDPYLIWLSEIILQQTQVTQGLPYFKRIVQAFPSVHDLARAPENQVMKQWEGLGYYSRARNLQKTARIVSKDFNGTFPDNYTDLLKLPGIGPYTASAISAFAFGLKEVTVDGNVLRMASRYFGIETDIRKKASYIDIRSRLSLALNAHDPIAFNNATMELGARVCGKSPVCNECPLAETCYAFETGRTKDLPYKSKLKKKKRVKMHFLLSDTEVHWIKKRPSTGIWSQLYEYPGWQETESTTFESHLSSFKLSHEQISPIDSMTHLLTHIKMEIQFWSCRSFDPVQMKKCGYQAVNAQELKDYAFPKIFHWFSDKF